MKHFVDTMIVYHTMIAISVRTMMHDRSYYECMIIVLTHALRTMHEYFVIRTVSFVLRGVTPHRCTFGTRTCQWCFQVTVCPSRGEVHKDQGPDLSYLLVNATTVTWARAALWRSNASHILQFHRRACHSARRVVGSGVVPVPLHRGTRRASGWLRWWHLPVT